MSDSIASASELCVSYSSHTVLDGATLAIQQGDRIGLVGRNGCGKSTFLKILAGENVPDSGEVTRKRGLLTGYLPQNFELDDEKTVIQNVLSGVQYVLDMIEEYETSAGDDDRSAELLDLITHHQGWDLEHQAQSLLTNLHAPDADSIVGPLSGGEKRRVALCRALLSQPDFLILDEPTNHLDTGSIEWLEQFLSRYNGTCLFVTHDRYFLDRIATRIVEIRRGKCDSYQGNYTEYLVSRAERDMAEARNEHKRQRFLSRELEWVRRGPKARTTKAKDRMDRYFEIADQEAPEQELDVDLIIPKAPKLGNKIIDARGLGMAFGDRRLFADVDLSLEGGQRLGIVGRNGMGKSTLLKIILGQMEPLEGKVEIGMKTEINFIDQNRLLLDEEKSVFEEVGEGQENVRLGDETIGLRAYLRRFLFTEERINTKINLLSGGERSRVMLAKILKRGGNVLVLDEPTNDLDLNTLRLLEEALCAFQGSVIVVSHDRYFLNRVCSDILAFEGDGVVDYQVGNYDYYLEKKAAREATAASYKNIGKKEKPKARKERPRKLKWAEAKELETIEDDILAAEEKASELTAAFEAPDFYEKHGDNWQQLEAELKQAKEKVQHLYTRWEELEAIRAATEQ
ncbi:ATP-binding cassette domain-containing protein [Verrucomicrobiaceae bacterium R5-34]|nr:ATP-binding cassette domain-containing protein [Verrucomicrobiaceae bacterium R5-34]